MNFSILAANFNSANIRGRIKAMGENNLINKETINYLSALSRIKIKESEREKLEKDLNVVLDYVKQLQAIDTSGIDLDEELLKMKIEKKEEFEEEKLFFEREDLLEEFYHRRDKWLEIPPIF